MKRLLKGEFLAAEEDEVEREGMNRCEQGDIWR